MFHWHIVTSLLIDWILVNQARVKELLPQLFLKSWPVFGCFIENFIPRETPCDDTHASYFNWGLPQKKFDFSLCQVSVTLLSSYC